MVTIKDLAFSYGKKEVLRGVDLELPVGQIHGILGMNGAGKTTLFHLLYQRLVPTAGDCRWQHRALLPEHIAFQETEHYFYPYLKGREYLELLSQSNPDFSIDRWNDIFELPLDQLIDGYSTGMRKKLAFIGVLSLDRPILLLDEVAAHLDATRRAPPLPIGYIFYATAVSSNPIPAKVFRIWSEN